MPQSGVDALVVLNLYLLLLGSYSLAHHYVFSCLQSGQFSEDMIPTVGFNMRKISKGNVTIKVSLYRYINISETFHGLPLYLESFLFHGLPLYL